MPYQSVRLAPGIDIEKTPLLNQGAFSDSQLIRWEEGIPQKIGGWMKYVNPSITSPIRALHSHLIDTHSATDLESADKILVAAGSDNNLQAIVKGTDGTLYSNSSITPLVSVKNIPMASFTTYIAAATPPPPPPNANQVLVHAPANGLTVYSSIDLLTPISVDGLILSGTYTVTPNGVDDFYIIAASNATSAVTNGGVVPRFTSTTGSPQITVLFPNHGLSVNDQIDFKVPTVVDPTLIQDPTNPTGPQIPNITISGVYKVFSIVGTNNDTYTIIANRRAQANNTIYMNGGNAQLVYFPVLGPDTIGIGWGGDATTAWGQGTWGYGIPPSGTINGASPTTSSGWTLDNWGTWLVACQDNGHIYFYDPDAQIKQAQLIAAAPAVNHGIFVSMPLQILVAYGSTDLNGVHDPMLVRWCDQANFNDWTARSINQAGSFRIPEGSQIIGGMSLGQQALLWTDYETWSMTYMGPPLIFGFTKISMASGIVSRHAATQLMDETYWMGQGNFFKMSGGGVQEVQCTVWDKIFQNVNRMAQSKICAAANSLFNEISWFFPSAATIPPNFFDTKTGNTHSNKTIDNLSADVGKAGWLPGMRIAGTGIPAGTTIVSVASNGKSAVLSQAATATATGVAFTVINADPALAEPDTYVKYTLSSQSWDYGLLQRTAWLDQGVQGPPLGGTADGQIYQHELSHDADGAPLLSSLTTAWFLISEGDPVTFVDLLLPDFKWGFLPAPQDAKVLLTIQTADWPGGPVKTLGPYTVTSPGMIRSDGSLGKPWVNVRARGRMMRCIIASANDIGSFWRLGDLRYRGTPDGRRGD